MMLFHVKATENVFWADRKRSNGFFDGVRNVTRAEKVFRTIVSLWLPYFTKDETAWYFIQFSLKAKGYKI